MSKDKKTAKYADKNNACSTKICANMHRSHRTKKLREKTRC